MKSENGEIEVFLCPEESSEAPSNSEETPSTGNQPLPSCSSAVSEVAYCHQEAITTSTTSSSVIDYNMQATAGPNNHLDLSHINISSDFMVKEEIKCEPSSEDVESVSSVTRVQNVLISEPEDFEPMGGGRFQLQTEDQHNPISGELFFCFHIFLLFVIHFYPDAILHGIMKTRFY
jgi:hypothetical protein